MFRVARGAVALLACAVAFGGPLLGGSADAQQFLPQPYLVYEVPSGTLEPPPVVDLRDQLGSNLDVPVLERSLFMNPVEKLPIEPAGTPEPITAPELHYRWYPIDLEPQGILSVQVTNQFGIDMPWEIEATPEVLLAPASKASFPEDPGPPPLGQHYDCYLVVLAPPAGASVDLFDQFGQHGPRDVGNARYLCVPVEKTTEDGTVYPIFEAEDGRDHLGCYDLAPHLHNLLVTSSTQFTALEVVSILDDRLLCVPSVKIYEKVPSLAPWGIAALGLLMLVTVFGVVQGRARHARPG